MHYLKIIYLVNLFHCLTVCLCSGFNGQITNIPTDFDELYLEKNMNILNQDNYQSRFQIKLTKIENTTEALKSYNSILNKKYQFKFADLEEGDYELLVSSYDLQLRSTRFRVKVENEIKIYEDFYNMEKFNESSEFIASFEQPLIIEATGFKQFYERSSRSIKDMIMESPFGFIFRSRLYTTLFSISMSMLILPHLISWINPELASIFEDIEEEKKIPNPVADSTKEIPKPSQKNRKAEISKNVKASRNSGVRKRH